MLLCDVTMTLIRQDKLSAGAIIKSETITRYDNAIIGKIEPYHSYCTRNVEMWTKY